MFIFSLNFFKICTFPHTPTHSKEPLIFFTASRFLFIVAATSLELEDHFPDKQFW
jgi:hypothetical protein